MCLCAGNHREQVLLQLVAQLWPLQGFAFDQKRVFHPFAHGRYFGQLHADAVLGECAGDLVEQAWAVAGVNGQPLARVFFFGIKLDVWLHGKAFGAA